MIENRLQKTIDNVNKFGYSDKGINRLAYSIEEQECLDYLINEMKQAGMYVRRDALGNVIGRRQGRNSGLPAVACGSHIDTVYDGGQYDGVVGVVAGLEVIRILNEKKIETQHSIELIIFACEESSRFGIGTIGSKAMTGQLKKEILLSLKDKNNISFEEALKDRNLDIEKLTEVERPSEDLKVFYEVHVEQGMILKHEQKQIGVVSGIAAPTRFELKICGEAAHSGATPMWLRKDALLGAAEIALEIEKASISESSKGTVATIGYCEVSPGAMNIVPGEVLLQVDIRSIDKNSKKYVVEQMYEKINQVKENRNLNIIYHKLCDDDPVLLDKEIIESVKKSCEELELSFQEMPSGAGHDSMNMQKKYPSALIFTPSEGGVSHNKNEKTLIEDIKNGVEVLKKEILKSAKVIN